MSIERRTHQIWLGEKIPKKFQEWRNKLIAMNPDWMHFLWTEHNVHELCIEPYQWEHSSKAGSSNMIRLHALRVLGGIYADVDCEPLRPLDPLLQHEAFVAWQPDGQCPCNAVFGAVAGHKWIMDMLANYGDQRLKGPDWGCHIMEPFLTPDVTILPTDTFFPYNFDEKPKPPTENTLLVHHWEGSWLP